MDNGITCRGSIALGSGCRKCKRCMDELLNMMDKGFDNFSDDQLSKELEKRQQKSKRVLIPKPLSKDIINIDALIKLSKEYIKEISDNECVDEDYDHWFFETVMETIYGIEIWDWINANT